MTDTKRVDAIRARHKASAGLYTPRYTAKDVAVLFEVIDRQAEELGRLQRRVAHSENAQGALLDVMAQRR